jgi:uncharacterized LabA/DUF88 family protein
MNPHAPYAPTAIGSSILLIDLENFYLAREHNCGVYAATELSGDLEALAKFAHEVSAHRRLNVCRAYANYNSARQASEFGRWDFFLQKAPKALMERGIEPVQVFRFPGGGNKNAADMRLAMDASVLVSENHRIEQCVLVTGDADFIPLILDLKRRGIEVVVIGVRGHTKTILERYCDRFEYFEDLIAAAEVEGESVQDLDEVRQALAVVLARRQPLVFAAVKPLLSRQLGRSFDPTRYDCENVGEFLRAYAEKLEIAIAEGPGDWEVRSRGAEPPAGGPAFGAGVVTPPAPALLPELTLRPAPPPPAAPHVPEHSTALYHKLLRFRRPNLHVVPRGEWETITSAIWALAVDELGRHREIEHQKLLDAAADVGERAGIEMAYHKVNGTLFQLFKSGCFVCAAEGVEKGHADFHWTLPAQLAPEIDSLAALRRRVRLYVVRSLRTRLESVGIGSPIDARVLAELLEGADAKPEHVDELRALIEQPSRPLERAPAGVAP